MAGKAWSDEEVAELLHLVLVTDEVDVYEEGRDWPWVVRVLNERYGRGRTVESCQRRYYVERRRIRNMGR